MAKKKAAAKRKIFLLNKTDQELLQLIVERGGVGTETGAFRFALRQVCPEGKAKRIKKADKEAALALGENSGEPYRAVYRVGEFDFQIIAALQETFGVAGEDGFDSTVVRYAIRETAKLWQTAKTA